MISYKGKRALIIDDLPEARSYTTGMLRNFGVEQVTTCASGEEALGLIRDQRYDLVLCDYNLGEGKDGQQVLEEVRHSDLLPHTSAFVMITADSSPEMVMGALEYQPDGYITKPYNKRSLRERLDRLMSMKLALAPIEKALDQGKYLLALKACEAVAETHPDQQLRAARHKGHILLLLRRFDEARDLYEELLKARPIAWARLGLGKALYYLDQTEQAEQQFRQLAEENTAYVESLDWLAQIQHEQGRTQEAQENLQRAIEQSPKAVLRQQEMARVAEINGDKDACEQAYRKSVRLGRHSVYKNPESYFGLVKALESRLQSDNNSERKRSGDEAMRMLKEVDRDFDDRTIRCRAAAVKAEACTLLGKTREAEQARERAAGLLAKIDNPDPALQALVEGASDERGKSEEHRKAAYEHSESLNNEGVAYYKAGDVKRAFRCFEEAVRNPDASISVLLNALQTGLALAQAGKAPEGWREEIDQWFQRVLALQPDTSRMLRVEKLLTVFGDL